MKPDHRRLLFVLAMGWGTGVVTGAANQPAILTVFLVPVWIMLSYVFVT